MRPSACCRVRISWSKAAAPIGSRPAVGSSRNSSAGSSASARASAGALAHAAGQLRGQLVGRRRRGRPGQLRSSASPARSAGRRAARRGAPSAAPCTFSRDGQRREQRAVLVQHAGVAFDLRALARRRSARRRRAPRSAPACGWRRPRIERISTDLPVPEPPTTPMISPRLHVEVEVLVHDLLAEAVDQPAHADDRIGVGSGGARRIASPVHLHEEQRGEGVEQDHQRDRLHHAGGRALADRLRACPRPGSPPGSRSARSPARTSAPSTGRPRSAAPPSSRACASRNSSGGMSEAEGARPPCRRAGRRSSR